MLEEALPEHPMTIPKEESTVYKNANCGAIPALDEDVLNRLRDRRDCGTPIKALARELGVICGRKPAEAG